jgi:hypothetical protein
MTPIAHYSSLHRIGAATLVAGNIGGFAGAGGSFSTFARDKVLLRAVRKRYRSCMANSAHVAILERGVEAWNKWQRTVFNRYRRGTDRDPPDLSRANFFGARLNGVDLRRVNLGRCDLRSAHLVGADFRGSGIEGTRLAGADLVAAHFGPLAVQLRSDTINFYPPVTGSAFTRAGPNVADSIFGFTTIDSLDLRQWSGLELARHEGRSIVTIGTLV